MAFDSGGIFNSNSQSSAQTRTVTSTDIDDSRATASAGAVVSTGSSNLTINELSAEALEDVLDFAESSLDTAGNAISGNYALAQGSIDKSAEVIAKATTAGASEMATATMKYVLVAVAAVAAIWIIWGRK